MSELVFNVEGVGFFVSVGRAAWRKIDRVFLADESTGLLADLNLQTMVEGVETLSAHQLLTQLNAG